MKKSRYYVVWEGRAKGVFSDWKECEAAVKQYVGAKFKAFNTIEEATAAFRGNFNNYIGNKENIHIQSEKKPVTPSICVDAACSGNPGTMEFQAVETETHSLYFKQGPFKDASNNLGEFLAIAWALAKMKKDNCKWVIYSDSITAISWIKNKKINTKITRTANNVNLFILIDKALAWLKNNEYDTQILKWETALWGEIPADFGRK